MQGSSRDTDTENRLVDTEQEGGEGGTNGGSSMDTYILPCVNNIASKNLLHH